MWTYDPHNLYSYVRKTNPERIIDYVQDQIYTAP